MNEIETPKSSEIHYKNDQDKRCAPGRQFEQGSCLTLNGLLKMAESYNRQNEKYEDKKIDLFDGFEMVNPVKYKRYLLKQFRNTFKNCKNQRCWMSQGFTKYMEEDDFDTIAKNTFRPDGPKGRFEWLSTTDIDGVMKQYEAVFPDFKFMGAVPMDFDDIEAYGIKTMDFDELYKNNIFRIGFVFNLDNHDQSGSHWVSMFTDLKKGQVYYFDSYGIVPEPRVRKLIRRIITFMKKNGITNPITNYNKTEHQQEGSECGVYSINFILRLLNDESFETICKTRIPDKAVNKCRLVYFNNTAFDTSK